MYDVDLKMGNALAYSDYWNKLQICVRDSMEVSIAEQNLVITNTHSYRTYYVKRRLIHSQLLYLATDDTAQQVFLKIYDMQSYEEVRKLHFYLSQVKEKLSEAGLVKVLDFFFTHEKHKWIFVVVEEFIRGFTLENWLEYLSSDLIATSINVKIPVDRAVCFFYDIVKLVKESHERGLVLTTISTTNVMLERTDKVTEHTLLEWDGEAYVMKVAPYKVPGTKIPLQYVPPEGLSNRRPYDVWCCGIVLLSVSNM